VIEKDRFLLINIGLQISLDSEAMLILWKIWYARDQNFGKPCKFQRATTCACNISKFLESWQAAGWNSSSTANVARSYVCVRMHMVRRPTTRGAIQISQRVRAHAEWKSGGGGGERVQSCSSLSGRPADRLAALLLAEPAVGGNNFAEYILSWANSNWPPRMLWAWKD